ncbi:MAG TPA: hypothetical protein VHW05_07775 [Phenylobacterium sp.]|jgi:hypothetical protein|nr:hypothetical protein [Phenylobacterium sp.]
MPAPDADAGAGLDSEAAPPPIDSEAVWPDDNPESIPPTQDATLPVSSAPAPDLTLQPGALPFDEQFLPPLAFNSIPAAARGAGPSGSPGGLHTQPSAFGFSTPAAAGSPPAAGQTIAYGALRGPTQTEAELADLRRKQAAFWLEERLAGKPGWEYEPDVPRPGAKPLKPDVGTPQRTPEDLDKRYYLELKPNTPSGRAAAARAVKKYMDATEQKVRAIFYDPKDFM